MISISCCLGLTGVKCSRLWPENVAYTVNDRPKARRKTLSHYLIKVARLRASDPPPGNTVMWRGLSRLTDIALGVMVGGEFVVIESFTGCLPRMWQSARSFESRDDPVRSRGGKGAHPHYQKVEERLAEWVRKLPVDNNVWPTLAGGIGGSRSLATSGCMRRSRISCRVTAAVRSLRSTAPNGRRR